MVKIAIINGPNLNLLGKREPEIYGTEGFDSFLEKLQVEFSQHNIVYFQSNIEGELVTALQNEGFSGLTDAIILNAAAYSHTSIAIADAVKAIPIPVINVHLSNIYSREEVRHTDLISKYAAGNINGLGLFGYKAALNFIIHNHSII